MQRLAGNSGTPDPLEGPSSRAAPLDSPDDDPGNARGGVRRPCKARDRLSLVALSRPAASSIPPPPELRRKILWALWGLEWGRWRHDGASLTFAQVLSAHVPARAGMRGGRGAWYEYVPGARGNPAAIVLHAPDGREIARLRFSQRGPCAQLWHLPWRHLRTCDCPLCTRVIPLVARLDSRHRAQADHRRRDNA